MQKRGFWWPSWKYPRWLTSLDHSQVMTSTTSTFYVSLDGIYKVIMFLKPKTMIKTHKNRVLTAILKNSKMADHPRPSTKFPLDSPDHLIWVFRDLHITYLV